MSKKILYVDDDPEDAEIFCQAIKAIDESIVCTVVSTARDALLCFKPPCPDFVFLDYRMPIINGIALLRELQNLECMRETKVVMYATFMNENEINECKSIGVYDCMNKKGDFNEIVRSLRSMLFK